ncbi:hypothetical protein Aduo_003602 [Ancylostoma duodenale]
MGNPAPHDTLGGAVMFKDSDGSLSAAPDIVDFLSNPNIDRLIEGSFVDPTKAFKPVPSKKGQLVLERD